MKQDLTFPCGHPFLGLMSTYNPRFKAMTPSCGTCGSTYGDYKLAGTAG